MIEKHTSRDRIAMRTSNGPTTTTQQIRLIELKVLIGRGDEFMWRFSLNESNKLKRSSNATLMAYFGQVVVGFVFGIQWLS